MFLLDFYRALYLLMCGIFEIILALFRAFQCHVEGSLGRFGPLFGTKAESKNESKNGPEFGTDFGTEKMQKQAPKMDHTMVSNRLL